MAGLIQIGGLCPNCGAETPEAFLARDENRRLGNGQFSYHRCPRCDLHYLAEVPDNLDAYYGDDYYAVPSLARLEKIGRRQAFRMDLIRCHATGTSLLEIGSAFGVLAWQAKAAGFSVQALEMDARCCTYLRDVVGVDAIQSSSPEQIVEGLPPHDVIVLWHVLEHLPAPLALLAPLAGNLAPGGILVIATPNPSAWQFKVMGRHWPHVDAPRHTMLIPSQVLAQRAARLGLEVLYLSDGDADARSWNRFGWQRLLMNRVHGKWLNRIAFAVGTLLAAIVFPWDRRHGSAYTVVLRKT